MRNKTLFLIPLLALALLVSACGPAASEAGERTLSVVGSGVVYLTPDIAYLNVGVHTEDADIAAAVERNSTQAQALIDTLLGFGIAVEDIKTTNFSLWSYEDYDDLGMKFTTYAVDNTVYITVRDLSRLGDLLNAVVAAGANNINSIQFDLADKTAALEEARSLAMENANTLAGELAANAGLSLGEIQTLAYTDYYPSPYFGMGGGGAEAPSPSVPIQIGQMQVSVNVSVTFAIK